MNLVQTQFPFDENSNQKSDVLVVTILSSFICIGLFVYYSQQLKKIKYESDL